MDHVIPCPHPRPRRGIAGRLLDMMALRSQRRALRDLSPHLLNDIGLTPEAARDEAKKPIWDVPRHWRR